MNVNTASAISNSSLSSDSESCSINPPYVGLRASHETIISAELVSGVGLSEVQKQLGQKKTNKLRSVFSRPSKKPQLISTNSASKKDELVGGGDAVTQIHEVSAVTPLLAGKEQLKRSEENWIPARRKWRLPQLHRKARSTVPYEAFVGSNESVQDVELPGW